MERNSRTQLQGVVVSAKMDKTIVVMIETYKKHSKYAKRVKYRKRYYAHDENNQAVVGDTVTIAGCRPLSKTKRFRLVSIDKKAETSIKAAEAELQLEEEAHIEEALEVKKAEEAAIEEAPAQEEKKEDAE